jgi:hypothetical protein
MGRPFGYVLKYFLVGLSVLCSSLYFGTVAEEDVTAVVTTFVKGGLRGQEFELHQVHILNI